MTLKVNSKEVLKYLNELGYRNISSQQLQDFVRDLKILIKHDLKKETKHANQENIRPNKENFYYSNKNKKIYDPCEIDPLLLSKKLNFNDDEEDTTDVFSSLHSSSTISSRAKSAPKTKKVISIEIVKPQAKEPVNVECKCTKTKTKSLKQPEITTIADSNNRCESNPVTLQDIKTNKKVIKSKLSNDQPRLNVLKPKTSFIKPRAPSKVNRSDPVALYQHYQAEWKKQKLPGEDKHFNLRWAIRERMLGEPSIRPYSSNLCADKGTKKKS